MFGFAFSSNPAYLPSDLFDALIVPVSPVPQFLSSTPTEEEQPTTTDSSPLPSDSSPSLASTEYDSRQLTRKRLRSSTTQQHDGIAETTTIQPQPKQHDAQHEGSSEGDEEVSELSSEHGSSDDERHHKLYRTAVVAATVHRAREMHEQLSFLHAACHRQHDEIQQLRHQLAAATAALYAAKQPSLPSTDQPAPPTASSNLHFCLSSSVLNSSLLLTARVGISVTDGETGRLLDMNAHLLHTSGAQRSDAIGRPVVTPYADVMNIHTTWEHAAGKRSDVSASASVGSHTYQQYRSSYLRLRSLYNGEVDKVDALWRCTRGGHSIEINCGCWVADWVSVDDGEGGMRQRPARVVWILSLTDAKVLD